jgi:diguanylate cyclase (GGDEF)-like protein
LAIAGGLFLLPTVIGIDLTTDSGALALASQPPLWAALLIARHSRQGFVLAGLIAFLALLLYEQPGELAGWAIAGSIGALLYIRAVRLPRPDNRAIPVMSPVDAGLAIIATLFLGSFLAVSLDQPVRGFLIGSLATLVAATPLVQVMILRAREGELRDLERLASTIRERARLDSLTELPNRAALDDRLAEEVERSVRYRQPLSVLFLDIDHFKSINDARGHQVGDDVLRALADTLQATVRSPDFVARYGGEEFVVIAPGTWTVDAAVLGNRIRDAVARHVPQPLGSPITMSIGIAGVPEHGQDAASVLHVADLALYAAKAGGRDRIELGFIELP